MNAVLIITSMALAALGWGCGVFMKPRTIGATLAVMLGGISLYVWMLANI